MAQIIKKGPSYMVRITWRDVDFQRLDIFW